MSIPPSFDIVTEYTHFESLGGVPQSDLRVWVLGRGYRDVPEGGAGANIVVEGIMSDHFVFHQADGGSHRVLDLETWGRVQFSGFGFSSADGEFSHITQSGADVIFVDQGTTVEIANAVILDLADDMFLF